MDDLGSITQTAPMYYEIACFGGDEITFQARIGSSEVGCDVDPPWGVDPVWLDPCKGPTYLEPIEALANSWRLVPTWSPGIDTSLAGQYGDPPEDWPIVEVTGTFDHPAAQTCRNRLNYDEPPSYPEPDPAYTILGCRDGVRRHVDARDRQIGIATRNNERRARRRGVRCSGDSVVQRQPK